MWLLDIAYGAISSGVNLPTHVAVNVILGLAFLSLLTLLAASVATQPWLVPHVIVLLLLAAGLWASINWFIAQTGIVDASQQRKELFGEEAGEKEEGAGEAQGQEMSADDGAGKKKEL